MYETKYKTLRYSRHMGRELAFLTLAALINQSRANIENHQIEDLLERSVRVLVSEAEEQYKTFGKVLESSHESLYDLDLDFFDLTPQNMKHLKKKAQDQLKTAHSTMLKEIEQLSHSINAFSQSLSIPLLRTISDMPLIRDFAIALVKTYLNNQDKIDQLIDDISPQWPVKRMLHIDRDLIRVSACEMCYDPSATLLQGDSTPLPVVINEAVELAKKYGSDDSFRFVNGVLRELMPHAEKMRTES